jgi:hypothetical protein
MERTLRWSKSVHFMASRKQNEKQEKAEVSMSPSGAHPQ